MEKKRHQLQIRMNKEMAEILEKAAFYGKTSMNRIICDALDARKTFIEKKYLKSLDIK